MRLFRHHHGPQLYRFIRRFGDDRGFGPFGPFGRDFGGPRGGGFRLGRMLRDGELRLVALALLEEAPRHGYDIIKALEERSRGVYSPSPGVVYPTLTYLEEAGYASSALSGNKKVYTIADAGRAYLDENRDTVETILEQMTRFGDGMKRAREWFGWLGDGEEEGPEDAGRSGAMADLDRSRRRLRALIAATMEGSDEDRQRVADILNRAADEILGKHQQR
jgi:DNA-binding PadR family transcriptional regulator